MASGKQGGRGGARDKRTPPGRTLSDSLPPDPRSQHAPPGVQPQTNPLVSRVPTAITCHMHQASEDTVDLNQNGSDHPCDLTASPPWLSPLLRQGHPFPESYSGLLAPRNQSLIQIKAVQCPQSSVHLGNCCRLAHRQSLTVSNPLSKPPSQQLTMEPQAHGTWQGS